MEFEKPHNVDLLKYECDCVEFAFKRQFLPEGSLGRACKHMIKAFDSPTIEKQIPRLQWTGKLFQLIQMHSNKDQPQPRPCAELETAQGRRL